MSRRARGEGEAEHTADAQAFFDSDRGLLALWFGLLAGPAAWFLHLNISYSLVRLVCSSGQSWLLHFTTLATVLLAAAGIWVAWGSWKRVGQPGVTKGAGTLGRSRFLALSGIGLSGFFLLIILLAWIPDFLLHPCVEL